MAVQNSSDLSGIGEVERAVTLFNSHVLPCRCLPGLHLLVGRVGEVKIALGHLGVQTPDLGGWFYASDCGYGIPDPPPS